MKVIAFKNEEEYYHVVHKIKKMKKFLNELCNVIMDSHEGEDEDDDEDEGETIVYKGGKEYHVEHDDMNYRGRGKVRGGRFSY